MVVIYKVMYREHGENTKELKLWNVSTMNPLIDFGVCVLAGCKIFNVLHIYFKHIF